MMPNVLIQLAQLHAYTLRTHEHFAIVHGNFQTLFLLCVSAPAFLSFMESMEIKKVLGFCRKSSPVHPSRVARRFPILHGK